MMKKTLLYISICAVTGFAACTKTFTDINTNPNQFEKATPEATMSTAVKRTSDLLCNINMNYAWTYSHLLCINGGSSRYGVGEDGFWEQAYVEILGNLNQLITAYENTPGFENRIWAAKTWQMYVYSILVGSYGPVPMKNALRSSGSSSSTILFDPEDSVYTNILTTLKDAADKIDPAKDKFTYDVVYSGDMAKWKKFANTLRLKIALRCRRNLPALADQHITEVMANEANTISAEIETAKMAYENVDGNQSPYYVRYVRNATSTDNDPRMSDLVFTYFRSYKDPRLPLYYDSVANVANRYLVTDTLSSTLDDSLRIVTYRIPYFGLPKAPRVLPGWGITDPVGGLNINSHSSAKRAVVFDVAKPFIHLSYGEAMFMKAEAKILGLGGAKTAEEYYTAGIDANFAVWGVTGTTASNYKNQDGVKFGTAGKGFYIYLGLFNTDIPVDDLTKVYIQQWLNYYPDGGFDSWCLLRRARFIQLAPHTNPTNQYISDTYSELPNRWVYPTTVINYNPGGYNDAVTQLGGDERSPYVNLKFLQPMVRKDWNTVTTYLNFGFVMKWYGNTIQELQNSGVPFSISKSYK